MKYYQNTLTGAAGLLEAPDRAGARDGLQCAHVRDFTAKLRHKLVRYTDEKGEQE